MEETNNGIKVSNYREEQVVYSCCLSIHTNEDGESKACLFFTMIVDDDALDPETQRIKPEALKSAKAAIVYLDDVAWVNLNEVSTVSKNSISNPTDVWRKVYKDKEGSN